MKSEPSDFSIDNLQSVGREPWDGIRNYQVRNMFRDVFAPGDIALFYHSNTKEIGIVGEMRVASHAYLDPTQFDPTNSHYDPKSTPDNPRWLLVDVEFVQKFARTITLQELKESKYFATLPIVRKGNRLSVVEIEEAQYKQIKELASQ